MPAHPELIKPACGRDSLGATPKIIPICIGNFDQSSLGSDDSGISCSSNKRNAFKTSNEDVSTVVSRESLPAENSEQVEMYVTWNSLVCIRYSFSFFVSFSKSPKAPELKNQSWLLRWFESKLFDMSYAIIYLFNSKESGVQTYIGNRIFSFSGSDVNFYLQQLVNMYINMHDVAEVLHPYLVTLSRCCCPFFFLLLQSKFFE